MLRYHRLAILNNITIVPRIADWLTTCGDLKVASFDTRGI